MKWLARLKIWWKARLYNGAVQSLMWRSDISHHGENLLLGKRPKNKGKNTNRKGKR